MPVWLSNLATLIPVITLCASVALAYLEHEKDALRSEFRAFIESRTPSAAERAEFVRTLNLRLSAVESDVRKLRDHYTGAGTDIRLMDDAVLMNDRLHHRGEN